MNGEREVLAFILNSIPIIILSSFVAWRARQMGFSMIIWFIISSISIYLNIFIFFFIVYILASLPDRSLNSKRKREMALLEKQLEEKKSFEETGLLDVPRQTISDEKTVKSVQRNL
jgi:hypothetical protein